MRKAAQTVPHLQIVTFRLGAEEFGADVFSVHEVLRFQGITAVPQAPDFVEGVIDIRGGVVPVIDLRRRFQLTHVTTDSDTRILVVQMGEERIGIVVDAVHDVLRVPEPAVSAPPAYFKGLAAEYLRGIARLENRLVVLLDIERVLSSQERIALEETDFATTLSAGEASPADSEEQG